MVLDVKRLANYCDEVMDQFILSYGFVKTNESKVEEQSFDSVYMLGKRYVIFGYSNYAVDHPYWPLHVKLKIDRISGLSFLDYKKIRYNDSDSEYLNTFINDPVKVLMRLKDELTVYANDFLSNHYTDAEFRILIDQSW